MEWASYFRSVVKGVLWALMIMFLATAIFSLVMNSFTFGVGIFNIIYVLISSLALVVGAIIAVKSYGSKGWVIGLAVGCMFYIALYIIGVVFGAEPILTMYDFIKFALCIFIGILAGMLGVNL